MAEFRVSSKAFEKDLKKVKNYLNGRFPKEVLADFKANTPKDTGNARKNTKLKTTFKGKEIRADYPYSGVIDKGQYPNPPKEGTGKTVGGYSTQARNGLVKPTLKEAEDRFDKFLRRLK